MHLRSRERNLPRIAAAGVALTIGGWISTQLWSQWLSWRASRVLVPDAADPAPRVVRGPTPLDDAFVLGTDASLSETPLKLVLVATHPGRTLAESTAALGTDRRNPQTYAGGAVLSNGARIIAIRAEQVVLSLRGRQTTLRIDPSGAAAPVAGLEGDAGSVGFVRGTAPPPARPSVLGTDLSQALRAQPDFKSGALAGFKVLAGTNQSSLAALGLEQGDVIRSISGAPVVDERAWDEIEAALSSGGALMVEVERKGKLLSVALDGQRIVGGLPAI